MQSVLGGLSSLSEGTYKKVLTAANSDYIQTNQVFTWVNTSDINFSITFNTASTPYGEILQIGNYNDSNTGMVRLVNHSSGSVICWIYKKASASTYDGAAFTTYTFGTEATITLLNRELKIDGVLVYTLGETNLDFDINGTTRAVVVGSGADGFMSGYIKEFQVNGETFNLNEASGSTVYGDNGSTATINTSHADANYIDREVHKLDSKVPYKKVLTAANVDHIILDNNVTWTNLSDVDVEVGIYLQNNANFEVIFSKGGVDANGGLVRLSKYYDDGFGFYISKPSNPAIPDRQFQLIPMPIAEVVNTSKIAIRNLGVYADDVLIHTLTEMLGINISPTVYPTTLGRQSYDTSWPLNGAITSVRLGGETFPLDEASGATVYGSAGTTGTINTSHGSASYIDREVNKRSGGAVEYKNVLTAANSDALTLNTELFLGLNEYIEFEIYTDPTAANVIFSSNDGLEDYIGVLTNGNLFVQQDSIFNGSTVNIPVGWNTIKYRRDGAGVNYISANGGAEYTLGALTNIAFGLKYIGYRSGTYVDCQVKKFVINGERFSLNEASGSTVYGSNGTTGTILTSHSDPNYIDREINKRY